MEGPPEKGVRERIQIKKHKIHDIELELYKKDAASLMLVVAELAIDSHGLEVMLVHNKKSEHVATLNPTKMVELFSKKVPRDVKVFSVNVDDMKFGVWYTKNHGLAIKHGKIIHDIIHRNELIDILKVVESVHQEAESTQNESEEVWDD